MCIGVAIFNRPLCPDPLLRLYGLQAASPALSYSFGALLPHLQQQQQQQQHGLQCLPALKALLALCGVCATLWSHHQHLDATGILCQAAATAVESLWCRLHLAALQPHKVANSKSRKVPGSSPGGSKSEKFEKNVLQEASPLVLLAGSAPAAVLALALPTALHDGFSMDHDKFRYRAMLPAAAVSCVLACCIGLLQYDAGVLHSLAVEPWGVLARVVRDVMVALAAGAAYNERLCEMQWLGYAIAQMANVSLCWDTSSSSSARSSGVLCEPGDSRSDGTRDSKVKQW